MVGVSVGSEVGVMDGGMGVSVGVAVGVLATVGVGSGLGANTLQALRISARIVRLWMVFFIILNISTTDYHTKNGGLSQPAGLIMSDFL